MSYGNWKPYVPVAKRRAQAKKKMLQLQKKNGITPEPIEIQGRKIAKSFWGASWCDHLESYSDLANRLDRGKTYARNGSVCHLAIKKGSVNAIVSGSDLYNIKINIDPLKEAHWVKLKKKCTGKINSILSLLQGKLPDEILKVVTDKKDGLFPAPKEISFSCDCPDYATMCKHIAAVIYGIGARLDQQPELLFSLRGVDHTELITADVTLDNKENKGGGRRRISSDSLEDVFGIEMTEDLPTRRPSSKKVAKKATKKTSKKVAKKVAKKTTQKKAVPPFNPTAENVRALREKFGMTPIQFALLLAVSTETIKNWEAKSGPLTLRSHTKEALLLAATYTKSKAWDALAGH